jgi:hypothetical protein
VPDSPADVLRSAASLMRERALKATPGPWKCADAVAVNESFGAIMPAGADAGDISTWLFATGRREPGATPYMGDAEHAASWHPLVALAVADWLDRFGDKLYCYGPAEHEAALKIARAYLNEGARSDA